MKRSALTIGFCLLAASASFAQTKTVGDVFFIPANLAHGPNEVKEPLYWLNVRWDVNWAQK